MQSEATERWSVVLWGVASLLFAGSAAADGWSFRAPYPYAIDGIAAASVDGALYALGGTIGDESVTAAVRRYDAATDAWTPVASMHDPRRLPAVAVWNGKIYAIGGPQLASTEVYDPVANEWSARAPLPSLDDTWGAATIGNRIYAHSAFYLYAYDPVADSWSARTPAPIVVSNAAVAAANGRLYVFGGSGGGSPGYQAVQIYDPGTNSWSSGTPIPIEVYSARAITYGGAIYLIGGRHPTVGWWAARVDVNRYDPVAATWQGMPPLNVRRFDFGAAALGSALYVVGGHRDLPGFYEEDLDSVERWRPEDPWIERAPAPLARVGAGAGALGGRIYVVGGYPGVPSLANDAVQEYDPESDTWTDCDGGCAPLPTGRQSLATTVVGDGLYAIGGIAWTELGQPGTLEIHGLVDRYDATADAWSPRASLPTPRYGLAAAVLDGRIYTVGGRETHGGYGSLAHERYDPVADAWEPRAPLPERRTEAAAAAAAGKLFVLGGVRYDLVCDPFPCSYVATRSADVAIYDPMTDGWSTGAPMPAARSLHTASVRDGRVYAIGGLDAAGDPTDTVFEYDPVANAWRNCDGECPPLPVARDSHVAALAGDDLHVIAGNPNVHHVWPIPEPADAAAWAAAFALALLHRKRPSRPPEMVARATRGARVS